MYIADMIRFVLYPDNIAFTINTMADIKDIEEITASKAINRFRNFASEESLGTLIKRGPQTFPNGKINPTNVVKDIFCERVIDLIIYINNLRLLQN
jgi:hypothetical protein